MTAIAPMFLGALFVVIGVLAAAAADRLRGVRWTKERAPRESRPRAAAAELATAVRRAEDAAAPVTDAHKKMRADVITALVQSGFKRPEATAAVDKCNGATQSTPESWTRAALKEITS